jgi:hypothetical protein
MQGALQQARPLPQRPLLDGALHADLDLVQRARFGHVVERAFADGFDGAVYGAVAGEHDHLDRRVARADGLQGRQAIHPRQAQIQQHDLRLLPLHARHRFLAGTGGRNVMPQAPQLARHHVAKGGVIVHQQDRRGRLHDCTNAGRTISNVEPRPGSLVT